MLHLISSSALANVILAEKKNNGATFTIKSIKTGKDYTYKIARKEFKGTWYTHVSVETRYQIFVYLGSYYKGKITRKRIQNTTPSATAISHILYGVEKKLFSKLDAVMELRHTGNCLRCGRPLTDPESIDRGLGPVCASL